MKKITFQARLGERVKLLSIILCASATGLGNYTQIPLEWSGLFEEFPDLQVDNTNCAS